MNKKTEKELKKLILDGLKFGRRKKDKNKYTFQEEQKKLKELFFDIFGTFEKKKKYNPEDIIFGKISNELKKNILKYIENPTSLDENTKKEVFQIGKKIISLLSSVEKDIPNKNINYYIENEMKSSGIALERFILYSIEKFGTNKNIKVEKAKKEFDPNKIDFITYFFDYHLEKYINCGIQLSITEKYVNDKENDLNNLRQIIDKQKSNFLENSKFYAKIKLDNTHFRNEKIPDLPVLFIINGNIGNLVRNTNNNNKNTFLEAYQNLGKKELLENFSEKYKNNFQIIGRSYPILFEHSINEIKKLNLKEDFSKEEKIAKGTCKISYDKNTKIYKIEYFKQLSNNNEQFLYSLEFFITEKFLKKNNKQK